MAGSTPIEAGKILPISMLLHDKDATKFIKAKIYNDANVILSTVTLVNIGGGLYSYDVFVMPDISYVKVQYDVFNDLALVVPSTKHGSDIDVFTNDRNNELLQAINNLLTAIQNVTGSLAKVDATIESLELVGAVGANVLEGSIEVANLSESIIKPIITGTIETDEIEGEIGCKK